MPLFPQLLKGFDRPVEVVRIEPPGGLRQSLFVRVDEHARRRGQLAGALDYWGSLSSIRQMRAVALAELSIRDGDVICDIGC